MSATSLVDGHVSLAQCKKAVGALLAHATKFEAEKAEGELLPGKEQNVWLVVNTKVMHPEKKIKPARMYVRAIIAACVSKLTKTFKTCQAPYCGPADDPGLSHRQGPAARV